MAQRVLRRMPRLVWRRNIPVASVAGQCHSISSTFDCKPVSCAEPGVAVAPGALVLV
jgi:hypothetical protein